MYYSAIVIGDHASEKVLEIAKACDLELKAFNYDSLEAKVLTDNLLEFMPLQACHFPLVLAGYEVVGAGEMAWLDLHDHAAANPHKHWEAGDED